MPINELLPFATAGGAGVMSQSDYAALAARLAGFVDGIAEPAEVNKVWRQSAFAAAMIGQFTADKSGQDTLDNGDVATFQANFTAAVIAALGVGCKWRGMIAIGSTGSFNPASYGLTAADKMLVMLWGAGGGATSQTGSGGGGGGGGGFAMKIIDAQSATITIGAGGARNTAGSNASAGGTTSFGAVFSATGGLGATAGPGAGGGGVGGDVNLAGSAGDDMLGSGHVSAKGGSAALMGLSGALNFATPPVGGGGSSVFVSGTWNLADNGGNGLAIIIY